MKQEMTERMRELLARCKRSREICECILEKYLAMAEDRYVVEIGAYTYATSKPNKIDITLEPETFNRNEAYDIASFESFQQKVDGRWKPAYAKIIPAKDWYTLKIEEYKKLTGLTEDYINNIK